MPETDWEKLSSLFSPLEIQKGDYFAIEGRVEKRFGFLKKGVLRAYYRSREGNEYNKTFFTENEFFGPYASMVSMQENKINIQALTNCQILTANYDHLKDLYEECRSIESLSRILAEYFFVIKEKREIEMALLEARDRYEIFKNEYPDLENIIPQYHIASYLGITPTQLSRIRSLK